MRRRSFLKRLSALAASPALPELPVAAPAAAYEYQTYGVGVGMGGLTLAAQKRLTAALRRSMQQTVDQVTRDVFEKRFSGPRRVFNRREGL